jgi:twitching motility protein PilT
MNIGSKAKSTIFDVFHIGMKSVMREMGLPSELVYSSECCSMTAEGKDLSKNIDKLIIRFKAREDAENDELNKGLSATNIGCRLQIEEGWGIITVPPFEWRHLPRLLPIDTFIESFVSASLRSATWALSVTSYVPTGFNINALIEEMEAKDASDLHLRAGNKPYIRVDNDLIPLDKPIISAADMIQFIMTLGGQEQYDILLADKESSFQYHAAGVGYLRCSGYVKGGAMALAVRLIPEEPIPLPKLALPQAVEKVCTAHRGLFLVCGVTGSGKSTTLAAMIDHINNIRKAHVITVEDPIEFVYTDKQSIISQRMVGRDTASFANALRGALREDPDVILVGEMRDMETIRAGLSAAETGHLVFSTLHTTTAVDTVNRVISYFPQSERDLIRQELAHTLEGVVCQRLLRKIGGGRVPAVEVLIGGRPIVRDAIIDGDLDKLVGIMENDSIMQTFDQYAVELYEKEIVTRAEAVSACKDEEAFERVISGIKSSTGRLLK